MTLVGAIACNVSHNLSSCNPPIARKRFESHLMTMLDRQQHIRQSFSVACNSDSEIMAALQTVETLVRTQRNRLDVDKFPMFWASRT